MARSLKWAFQTRTRLQFVLSELVVSALLVTACGAPAANIDDYNDYYLSQSHGEPKDGTIKVTWFGTTMLLFDDGETQLLIDGFLSRPTLKQVIKGPIQTDKALVDAVLSQFKVNRLKAMFVAHSHYDHAFDIAYIIQQTGARLHGSESTLNIGRGGI